VGVWWLISGYLRQSSFVEVTEFGVELNQALMDWMGVVCPRVRLMLNLKNLAPAQISRQQEFKSWPKGGQKVVMGQLACDLAQSG
jgi:hypothetical protein